MGTLRVETGTLSVEGTLNVDTATLSYSDIILADSPTGYWKFEETSGVTAFDSSGNSQDLVIDNAALNGTALIASGGLSANFGALLNSSAHAGSPLPVIPNLSTSFTMECWVQASAPVGGNTYVISYPQSSLGFTNGADIRITTTGVAYDVVTGAGLAAAIHSGAIALDTPIHLAMTYDGSFVRGYFNGVLETPVAQTGGALVPELEVNIGRFGGAAGGRFAGIVDEAAMYDTVLSDAQILAHYNAGI